MPQHNPPVPRTWLGSVSKAIRQTSELGMGMTPSIQSDYFWDFIERANHSDGAMDMGNWTWHFRVSGGSRGIDCIGIGVFDFFSFFAFVIFLCAASHPGIGDWGWIG